MSKPKPPKKPYSTPVLSIYGNLAQITGTVGNKGSSDNISKVNKTHFRKMPRSVLW